MDGFSFPGSYADELGHEEILWRAVPIETSLAPAYEFQVSVRGVLFSGFDFDGMEVTDAELASAAGLALHDHRWLTRCVLTGDLPCHVESAGRIDRRTLTFQLDLNPRPANRHGFTLNLRLRIEVDGLSYQIEDDWFEDGLLRLEKILPAETHLRCCVTCLYSDYSPGGHGLMGMRCHRDAKQQYLAVASKGDYWTVPAVEEVMETHVCPQYERRVAGVGYRG